MKITVNYRLDFNNRESTWNGAVATICEDPKNSVWGVLWAVDINDMAKLDNQEQVHDHLYYPKNVIVTTPDGQTATGRTYIETNNPDKLKPGEVLPYERRPSTTYLKVILFGAIESHLPIDYIVYLTKFSSISNRKLAKWSLRKELGTQFFD